MTSLYYGHYWVFLLAYFVVVTAALVLAVRLFKHRWVRRGRVRQVVIRLTMSLFSTLYLLLGLEAIFAYGFVQSDGFSFTLASRQWLHRHWHPINSYHYRDHEPVWRDKVVFVVGDSFAVGHGIANIDDRFADRLARKLGDGWTVAVLADNGWNPRDYLAALEKHDHTPDVLIVSYFVNDIETAAASHGMSRPRLRVHPPRWIAPVIYHSYLLDWVYWRIYRADLGSDTYCQYLERVFTDDEIWAAHRRELDALVAYGRRVDARTIFVVWPFLSDVPGSKDQTAKVARYLDSQGVAALDLAPYFEGRNPDDLIVNRMDAHPNERANAEVAELFWKTVGTWP